MKKYLITTVILIAAFMHGYAQQKITGSVYEVSTDKKKIPLPFANIYWVGENKGTVTNENGDFELEKNGNTSKLVASFIGFSNDTILVTDKFNIEFVLSRGAELSQVEVKEKMEASFISKIKPIKTEVITTAGLQKLACCNLSESFENSATVDVGFSDAVTGARQIQMLGLAGIYSQIMVENIPFTRGLGSAFGLTYIPGTWMESIQISKGTSSVVNGYESITGQINTEFKKPPHSERLFVNGYLNNEGRYELNANASTPVSDKLSTMVLAHVSQQVLKHDMNDDGFLDSPLSSQFNFSNRWSYEKAGITESKFGINFLQDERMGGQLINRSKEEAITNNGYVMEIKSRRLQLYDKTGFLFKKPGTSVGLIFSGLYHEQESMFGKNEYNAKQLGFYGNAIFQSGSPVHGYSTGVSFMYDDYDETFADSSYSRTESVPGIFAQYTYTPSEKMNFIAGVRLDYHNMYGTLFTPRAHFKVNLAEHTVLRTSVGKGYRSPSILAENSGVLVSSRELVFSEEFKIEEAWNYGINITQEIHFDEDRKTTITADFYRTNFINQVIVDLDEAFNKVLFYNLDGKSYSNSFQIDVTSTIAKGLDITAAYRLNDTKVTTAGELRQRPLVSKHKGLLTASYATRFEKWKFDVTGQYNGSTRLPLGIINEHEESENGYSPDYITVHTQVTRKFKHWDVYAGIENLTNFMQMHPVILHDYPFSEGFDAGVVWGPVFGRMFYGGFRYTIPHD